MKWAQITDKGLAREVNEDNLLVIPQLGLLAIADGMGGHRGGKIASSMALRTLEQELSRLLQQGGERRRSLQDAVKMANNAIFARSQEDPELKGMGTTITACLEQKGELLIAHIGDSRAYLLHRQEIRQLTKDHSVAQELLRKGGISKEQALTHPQKNMLTRALGAEPFVEVDIYLETLSAGDHLLLCTDGLTRYVSQTEIMEVLLTDADLERKVQTLLSKALAAGGADNITIVVACFE